MLEKKYKNFLNIILIIIILAIIGVGGYIFYEYVYLKNVIDANASDILDAFDKYMNDLNNNTHTQSDENNVEKTQNEVNEITDNNEQNQNSQTTVKTSSNKTSTTSNTGYALTYKGYGVLGKIELPKLNLKYPVLETMTDANAIDVSVAVQYGVGLNNIGNTVIIGHNYRNGAFFGSNKKLSEGDKVYITDNSGNRVEYTIYKKYITPQEDYSYAQRDTNGKREITLVTCHTDNKYRLVIFAREN